MLNVVTKMFVRKKKIGNREYYYLVQTTKREDGTYKKIEKYLGLHLPTKEDLQEYTKDFDKTAFFFQQNKRVLEETQQRYQKKIKNATKDERAVFENDFITKFTFDTNRIEGSTLTYKDTKLLLEEGISPREKPIRDVKEAENHKKAFLAMKEHLSQDISRDLILHLHKILKENVTEDAGSFRTGQVRVGMLIPVKADMIEVKIKNLLEWYKENQELHPLEKAAEFHCWFERIHPFFDGNGRVGRLLLNFILLKNAFPPIIVQNKNKRRYYTALQKADNGNILSIIKYLFFELQQQAKEW